MSKKQAAKKQQYFYNTLIFYMLNSNFQSIYDILNTHLCLNLANIPFGYPNSQTQVLK